MISNWKIAGVLGLGLSILPAFGQVTYLALGDSIPFGFDPTEFFDGTATPNDFAGYPEVLAGLVNRQHVNAACPGETSGSFITGTPPDNGCYGMGPGGEPPFKTTIGLHTPYTGSQLVFATTQLVQNKNIKLLTLSIGGNDLSLLQAECTVPPVHGKKREVDAACVAAQLPWLLQNYAGKLGAILHSLRVQANYSGDLILMNYYVPNTNPLFIQAVAALNATMATVGASFGVKIADSFTAFSLVSALAGGDPCKAGLLIKLRKPGPNGACDIHPSENGQRLLAATVLIAKPAAPPPQAP